MTDPVVRRYLGGSAPAYRVDARVMQLISGGNPQSWIVRVNGESEGVGLIEISGRHDVVDDEISYEFLPAVWGSGVALEAVGAVVRHAFERLGYQRLIAETQAANWPSRRLLEKLGMIHERDLVRFEVIQVIYATTGRSIETAS